MKMVVEEMKFIHQEKQTENVQVRWKRSYLRVDISRYMMLSAIVTRYRYIEFQWEIINNIQACYRWTEKIDFNNSSCTHNSKNIKIYSLKNQSGENMAICS